MTGTEAVNNNVIVVKPNTNTNTNADNAIKKDTNKSSSIWTTQVQQAVEQAKKQSGSDKATIIVIVPGNNTNPTDAEKLTPEEQLQRSKNIMDFFKGCDSKDKDGEKDNVITKQELYEAVKNKNPKAKIDDLAKQNEFFEKYDKNKDGELDFDEFSAMCKDKDYVYLAKKLKVNLHSENGVNMPSDDKGNLDKNKDKEFLYTIPYAFRSLIDYPGGEEIMKKIAIKTKKDGKDIDRNKIDIRDTDIFKTDRKYTLAELDRCNPNTVQYKLILENLTEEAKAELKERETNSKK